MKLVIIGQGYVGLPLAIAAAKANFIVYDLISISLGYEILSLGLLIHLK